jgi:ribosomal protein S18 acetylase RimI-like enzyme
MISLIPMSQPAFEAYRDNAIREYAQEHVRAGNWKPDEALARSAAEFNQLLPAGVNSPQQHLYSIYDQNSGSVVGMLWFAEKRGEGEPHAWIYDFVIQPEFRGKGYGAEAMRALEDEVRAVGLNKVSLHVFGHNQIARNLYEKAGYAITNILMSKSLA